MPTFKSTFEIEDVKVVAETAAALLCKIEGEKQWIPRSQIDDESECRDKGDEGTLVISQWLATQMELG
jgi:hypothetical protein